MPRVRAEGWGGVRTLAILFSIAMGAVALSEALAAPSRELVLKDAGTLRVDGRLGDWSTAGRLSLETKSQVVEGRPYWQGPESLSAKVYLSYDESNLYLAALVRQDHEVAGATRQDVQPQGDGLELVLSSGWDEDRSTGWTRRDIPLILAPGKDARSPVVWNVTRRAPAAGARLVAKTTGQGYLLEASMPWTLFPGIQVGPGKKARWRLSVHSGDAASTGLFFQLRSDDDRPASWPSLRFGGKATAETPLTFGKSMNEPDALRLETGLRGASPLEGREVMGVVQDASGHPASGAWVRLWPATEPARAGEDGRFSLLSSRLYDRTLLRATREGSGSFVASLPPSGSVTLRLPERWGSWDWGFVSDRAVSQRGGLCLMDPKLNGEGLSTFVEGARVEGIEPVICLPLDPKTPERVASLAASTLGKSAPPPRAWMFLPEQGVERPSWEVLNLHRRTYQALKSVLPGAWVLLDTAEAAQSGRWEAFADHAPETFEMVLAREDLRVRGTCDAGESARILSRALRRLQDAPREILSRLEEAVPVGFYFRWGCSGGQDKVLPALTLASIFAAWSAEPTGPLFFEREGGAPPVDSPEGRVAAMLSLVRGEVVPARSYLPNLRVCARRQEDGTLRLLAVNEDRRESILVKVALRERKSPVVVDAGSERRLEFELSSQSVALVSLLPSGSLEGVFYGRHHVVTGQAPQTLQVR